MLNSYSQFLTSIRRSIYTKSRWIIILWLMVCLASCTSPQSGTIQLTLNVQSAGRPGLYSVTGETNLPEHSQITVAAIRSLRPNNSFVLESDSINNYSILDRQLVRVEKGKWQATLNLWEVAPDGHFQEAWQVQNASTPSVEPSPDVSFVATFEPNGQLAISDTQQVKSPELKGSLVRFTDEGQPYVKSSQTLRIALPTGRKTPPVPKPEDLNGGWGNRYQIPPEPPVSNTIRPLTIKTEQTNAPLSPAELVR